MRFFTTFIAFILLQTQKLQSFVNINVLLFYFIKLLTTYFNLFYLCVLPSLIIPSLYNESIVTVNKLMLSYRCKYPFEFHRAP